jgi:8-oxo-dGTP pyrophosphatase MutT (NUDIX family)
VSRVPPPAWLTQALAVDYGEFLPLRAAERRFGWVRPGFAVVLARFPDVFECEPQRVSLADALGTPAVRTEALARVAQQLRDEGLVTGWRDEPHEIYAEASGEPLARIERAAVKRFGIRGRAVHLNGIVETDTGLAMWVARRSATKATDPDKLDNLVGGGVAAGLDSWQTLMKECREEAGLPFELAQRARPRDALAFDYVVDDGLDANEIEAFDLVLAADFEPRNEDGEVAGFELLPFDAVRERLEVPHLFTVDAALVAWTCVQRWAGRPL